MVFSTLGRNRATKTSGYQLVNRGSNDERELQASVHGSPTSTKASYWANPLSLQLAVILLIVSFLFNVFNLYKSHSSKATRQFVPEVPYTSNPVIFNQDNRWVGASPSVDAHWDKHINNANLGYISIPNPGFYNLKPGVNYGSNGTEIFSISFYHQLHCLAMIRHAYYHPLDSHMHHGSRSAPSEAAQRAAHLDHCFDYLRQGIECAADLTVEWAKVEYDGTRRQVDGWGIQHRQCRDPDAVEAFMKKHRAL